MVNIFWFFEFFLINHSILFFFSWSFLFFFCFLFCFWQKQKNNQTKIDRFFFQFNFTIILLLMIAHIDCTQRIDWLTLFFLVLLLDFLIVIFFVWFSILITIILYTIIIGQFKWLNFWNTVKNEWIFFYQPKKNCIWFFFCLLLYISSVYMKWNVFISKSKFIDCNVSFFLGALCQYDHRHLKWINF